MNEGFRGEQKDRREPHEDPQEHFLHKGPEMTRRVFTGGLAAFFAVKPMERAFAAQDAAREKKDEEIFQAIIRDPRTFRQNPTREQAASMVRSLAKASAEWAVPFMQDKYLMHRGSIPLIDHDGIFRGNGTIIKVPTGVTVESGEAHRYLIISAAHVADHMGQKSDAKWTKHQDGRDVAVRELTSDEVAELQADPANALAVMPKSEGKDLIAGQAGIVIAHDAKKTPPFLSKKLYPPSRITPPISEHVLRILNIPLPPPGRQYHGEKDYGAMRMMAIPAGEARRPSTLEDVRAATVSGSALLMMRGDSSEVALSGVFVAVSTAHVDGVTYDLGYVIDLKYVHEVLEEHTRQHPDPGTPPQSNR